MRDATFAKTSRPFLPVAGRLPATCRATSKVSEALSDADASAGGRSGGFDDPSDTLAPRFELLHAELKFF